MNVANELLALWELAAPVPPGEREDALLAAWYDQPPLSLGERNAALLGIRTTLLGPVQTLRCDCPACGETAEIEIDCAQLAPSLLPAADAALPRLLEAGGHRIELRVPDAADIREAARASTGDAGFVQILLERCITRCEAPDGSPCPPSELPATVAEAVSRRMEALEPGASVGFDLACPSCGEAWSAAMQVGEVIWSELQSRAERLLLDVAALARSFGWSESDILALSPTRRAAYLQLVGAA